MPFDAIDNPAGAYGLGVSLVPILQTVKASTGFAVNELVALHTVTGSVIRNLVATAAGIQCGVALETVATGDVGRIATGGVVTVKKGTGAISAGDLVHADTAVSGAVGTVTAATVITQAKDVRGFVGTAVADASAAASTVVINFGAI